MATGPMMKDICRSRRSHRLASEEGLGMESRSGYIHDAEIDGVGKLPSKQVAGARATWLLAGVALLSVIWAAVAIMLFVRAERPWSQKPQHSESVDVSVYSDGNSFITPDHHPSSSRRLFAFLPDSIREQGLPASQIGFATDLRAAEVEGREALWESRWESGIFPRPAQKAATDCLTLHTLPGRKIDGWVMLVGGWGIDRPDDTISLRFPDDLAGYVVWLSGYSDGDTSLGGIKAMDWVRVSGFFRPGSRMDWKPSKPDDVFSLGEITITDIQKVEAVPK